MSKSIYFIQNAKMVQKGFLPSKSYITVISETLLFRRFLASTFFNLISECDKKSMRKKLNEKEFGWMENWIVNWMIERYFLKSWINSFIFIRIPLRKKRKWDKSNIYKLNVYIFLIKTHTHTINNMIRTLNRFFQLCVPNRIQKRIFFLVIILYSK